MSIDIVKFRSMLSELLESKAQPLKEVPSEHLPVVAKLVHERYIPSVSLRLVVNTLAVIKLVPLSSSIFRSSSHLRTTLSKMPIQGHPHLLLLFFLQPL
jgi:hypothetical protein